MGVSSTDIREQLVVTVAGQTDVPPGAAFSGSIASRTEFEDMLGHSIPMPATTAPYTRESLIADLHQSALGRVTRSLLLRMISRSMGADKDDPNAATNAAFADGMPLRAIAMGSGGRVSLRAVDGLIRILNVGMRKPRHPQE